MNCLLARATLAVDRCPGNRFGAASCQPRGPSNVEGLWTNLVDTPQDDLIVFRGINADSIKHGRQWYRSKICRMNVGQSAVTTSDRCTKCVKIGRASCRANDVH